MIEIMKEIVETSVLNWNVDNDIIENDIVDKFKTSGSGIISSISNTEGIIEIDEKITKITKGMLLKFYKYEDLIN